MLGQCNVLLTLEELDAPARSTQHTSQETQSVVFRIAAVYVLLDCDPNNLGPTLDFGGRANSDRTKLRRNLAAQLRFRKIAQEGFEHAENFVPRCAIEDGFNTCVHSRSRKVRSGGRQRTRAAARGLARRCPYLSLIAVRLRNRPQWKSISAVDSGTFMPAGIIRF